MKKRMASLAPSSRYGGAEGSPYTAGLEARVSELESQVEAQVGVGAVCARVCVALVATAHPTS
jgi:hypothetical protein